MLNRLNLALALLLVAVVGLALFVRVDHSRPNYQITIANDMTYSPAARAYQANEQFANGRTMQSPVPGTIARGMMPLHFQATPEDATRAGEELSSPFDQKSEEGKAALERGAEGYQVFCTPCHGGGGAGDGLVAKRGFPPPPSLLTGKSVAMKEGQLFHILSLGQNSMPRFQAQLSPARRWEIIAYLRSLQEAAKQETTSAQETTLAQEATSAQETTSAKSPPLPSEGPPKDSPSKKENQPEKTE